MSFSWKFAAVGCFFLFVFFVVPNIAQGDLLGIVTAFGWLGLGVYAISIARKIDRA